MHPATELALALDPALLMEAVGLKPDPWQAALLRCQAERILLLASRQSGKSSVAAALALHTVLYEAPALVLLLSPSLRQSQELFRKIIQFYDMLNRPVPPRAETSLSLELTNDSRVLSLPSGEANLRGFANVSLVVLDEAGRISDSLYYCVRPTIATSKGRLIALTTPNGKQGFFHRAWEGGGPLWTRFRITAEACPRIPMTFLQEEQAALGHMFAQEYMCEFLDSENAVFDRDMIQRAISPSVEPIFLA